MDVKPLENILSKIECQKDRSIHKIKEQELSFGTINVPEISLRE